jgi:hypothetical protein
MSQSSIISLGYLCGENTDIAVSIFPNPSQNNTTISLKLIDCASVRIEVYNSVGQLVETIVNQTYEPGIEVINVNTTEYYSGLYFFKTIVNQTEHIQKFIKL